MTLQSILLLIVNKDKLRCLSNFLESPRDREFLGLRSELLHPKKFLGDDSRVQKRLAAKIGEGGER